MNDTLFLEVIPLQRAIRIVPMRIGAKQGSVM
jgi:hypothetical protein